MARKKTYKKKDKFADLTNDFKDAVMQSSTDEIRKRVSNIAILDCEEKALLKKDPAIADAKLALKRLMDPVRENLKSYRLQLEFCKKTLDEKGVGSTVAK